jgi:succinate-acetate transporter protein
MRRAMGANTLEKSYKRENSFSTIFGIFGRFWWFLVEIIFHEKEQLLDV